MKLDHGFVEINMTYCDKIRRLSNNDLMHFLFDLTAIFVKNKYRKILKKFSFAYRRL
jgi:hypothetical protein